MLCQLYMTSQSQNFEFYRSICKSISNSKTAFHPALTQHLRMALTSLLGQIWVGCLEFCWLTSYSSQSKSNHQFLSQCHFPSYFLSWKFGWGVLTCKIDWIRYWHTDVKEHLVQSKFYPKASHGKLYDKNSLGRKSTEKIFVH